MSDNEAVSWPWDDELKQENDLLARLKTVEKHARIEMQNAIGADLHNTLSDMLTLIRAYRRKWHEAHGLKECLKGIKDFLEESYDAEEEDFDPSMGMLTRLRGHWCAALIEEIESETEEGTVYVPHLIPAEGGWVPPPPVEDDDGDDEDLDDPDGSDDEEED